MRYPAPGPGFRRVHPGPGRRGSPPAVAGAPSLDLHRSRPEVPERTPPGGEGSPPKPEGLVNDERTDRILRRLRSVEGHVRGIERMVEDGAYCVDVVNQIRAVQRALEKVSTAMLDRHLHTCVTPAVRGDDDEARERVLDELLAVFQAAGRG